MKIGIIGAGWYGSHIALELKKAGHDVVVFEKNSDIFKGISGEFGIRLHKGPHYPRSKATRQSCLESFHEFCNLYPDLIQHHDMAIYALGTTDAEGNPPKVDLEAFETVCRESKECIPLDPKAQGLTELQSVMSIDEPSIVLGNRLRRYFKDKLQEAGVDVRCNANVQDITRMDGQTIIHIDGQTQPFDYVVNATSFQAFIPDAFKTEFPVETEVVYQPCLALKYKDKSPGEKPISFIVMDGWFPCLMPTIDIEGDFSNYIMTHGSYTIMGSYHDLNAANQTLSQIDDNFIGSQIKPKAEAEMVRFWPGFLDRFEYTGFKGTVLAKLRTKSEFRSALTFEHARVIYIFPGKVSNVVNASREVIQLLNAKNCQQSKGFRFISDGVLHHALQELAQKPAPGEPNTCSLDTFSALSRIGFFGDNPSKSPNGISNAGYSAFSKDAKI